eukprot:TRINITY_DN2535_c0_g2_i2.p1 TRINITY_DN2535_c0_g2~~TRINITY_DN2535_c0_g2_i2.p1  ORF type:complete len:367 (-),score=83.85 TRINITY_DN2535_c0_g2_i2:158-1258(-)
MDLRPRRIPSPGRGPAMVPTALGSQGLPQHGSLPNNGYPIEHQSQKLMVQYVHRQETAGTIDQNAEIERLSVENARLRKLLADPVKDVEVKFVEADTGLRDTNKKLRERIAELVKEIDDRDRIIDELKKKHSRELTELRISITDEFNRKIDGLNNRIRDLEAQLAALRRDYDAKVAELEKTKKEAERYRNENDRLKQDLDSEKRRNQEALAKLQRELEDIRHQHEKALREHENSNKSKQHEGVRDKILLSMEIDRLHRINDELLATNSNLLKELNAIKEKISGELQRDMDKYAQDNRRLTELANEREKEIQRLRLEIENMRKELMRRDADLNKLRALLDELRANHNKGGHIISTLEDTLNRASRPI